MNTNFGLISFREFSIFSPESIVPVVFYNCCPGYTDGRRNPAGTLEDAQNARVYYFSNPDGSASESRLDHACKFHDVKTAYAIGRSDERDLIFKADMEFVSELIKSFPSFQPVEKEKWLG